MIRLENSLDECLDRLKERCRELRPETDLNENDDLDSIGSSSMSVPSNPRRVVRFAGQEREVGHLRRKLSKVETDNMALRRHVKQLQALLRKNDVEGLTEGEEMIDHKENGHLPLSEGGVWNLVHSLNKVCSTP
jgi:methyl coenzyme M reductase subunit D